MTILAHVHRRRIPAGGNEPAQLATGHAIHRHGVHAAQGHKQCRAIQSQRDPGWRETDLPLAERGNRDGLDDAVAPRVDHTHRVGAAVGDVQVVADDVPRDPGGMTTDRNDFPDDARHEVHPHHTARRGNAAGVHAHQLGEGIAALFCRAVLGSGFAAAEVRDVRHGSIRIDDRRDGQDTEWDGLEQRAVVRVEHREGVVRHSRRVRATSTGRRRYRRCHTRRSARPISSARAALIPESGSGRDLPATAPRS